MKLKPWVLMFVLISLVFIFGCQIFANISQWQRGPSVHIWMEEKRNALLYPQFFKNASSELLCQVDEINNDRAILQQYSLSAFSPQSSMDIFSETPDGILRFSGWYDDDWIGRRGYAVTNIKSGNKLYFSGYVPDFITQNQIEVKLNDKVVFDDKVAGNNTISFETTPSTGMNEITVICGQEVIPASIWVNSDTRPLAFHLSIEQKR